VFEVNDCGGIVLDKTVFYVTGGGQPGDSGVLTPAEGATVEISTTVYDDGGQIVHVPAALRPLENSDDLHKVSS